MIGRSLLIRKLWLVAGLMLALMCTGARADTPISLFKSFAGNYNFTGTEATIRTSGTNYCTVIKKNTTVNKTLSTVPTGATVQAAYLYWAGSGSAADFTVSFEGRSVSAQRQYTGSFVNGATNYYFSGVADVTSVVKAKSSNGNGTYNFGGLTVDTSTNYCNVQGVVGGFALLVVYTLPSEPFRVLNMYEGFQSIRNSSTTLNLANFRVPNPIGSATGRIGHITWEGDQNLNLQGENLTFNGVTLSDANNPSGNQFNSNSNIDANSVSYGIDFDAYTVASPTIKADDTTAITTYASGQDLVWLNVELVAVPNVPTADIAIAMVRTGEPVPGGSVKYTLTVTNNGPFSDPGPITVTNTLPAGMSYGTVSGTGWVCTISGVTATCTSSTALSTGLSLPAITVNTLVSQAGSVTEFTNTAKALGTRFDNVAANDTASDTSYDTSALGGSYVFTDSACTPTFAIGSASQPCKVFSGPYRAASGGVPVYITFLKNGVPAEIKNNGDTRIMRFSLTCINPRTAAGVSAQYAGQNLLCVSDVVPAATSTSWSGNVTISWARGAASGTLTSGAAATFQYNDVGLISLNLIDNSTNNTVSARFVSAPTSVTFSLLQNQSGGNNPAGAGAFAKAGEPFNVAIKVSMANNAAPPNFGNGTGPYGPVGLTIGHTASDPTFVAASLGAVSGGVSSGTVTYTELGNLTLTALLAGKNNEYAAGTYFGAPVTSETKTVGYFYPAYFETTAHPTMVCQPRMNCPVGQLPGGDVATVSGAAYSWQSFDVDVKAVSNAGKDVTAQLVLLPAKSITLAPYDKPGPTGTLLSYTGAALNTSVSPLPAASVSIKLPVMFNAGVPTAAWTVPATVYWRATMAVDRAGTTGDTVSSSRTAGASKEGGVQVVTGRMLVANGVGSELLKMPLRLYSQYWTGSFWENLTSDESSPVSNAANFTNCQKNLNSGATAPNNCKPAPVLALENGLGITLAGGQGSLMLKAPGAGNTGSAMVQVPGTPTWLPSTIGQVAFGVYKNPIIYIREVY